MQFFEISPLYMEVFFMHITGNYFMLPNDVFNLMLTPSQLAVFCYLVRCSDKSWTCYPSIPTIAQACRLSENTVRKALKYLNERDIITISGGYSMSKFGKMQNATYVFGVNPNLFEPDFSRKNLTAYFAKNCSDLNEGGSCNE